MSKQYFISDNCIENDSVVSAVGAWLHSRGWQEGLTGGAHYILVICRDGDSHSAVMGDLTQSEARTHIVHLQGASVASAIGEIDKFFGEVS